MLYFCISFKEKNHHFLLQLFQLRYGITSKFNDYKKTITPKVKNTTAGVQDDFEYSSDYEYSSDSYTENDPGGGIGDDMDSFDYADDFGNEDIH